MGIIVNSLSKVYGQQKAVNAISFEAKRGRILGFLGPNGAGKSTTMKMLTGFIPKTSGTATVCGFDITDDSLEVRRNIGYLPENNPLYEEMYVAEFLYFVGDTYRIDDLKARVEQVIRDTGLSKERYKKIAQLSKGYRQRVGLAQAIIHNPNVLILDEPTSGLDPNQLIEVRALIKELGKTKTVVLSTHIMQEVEAICDDVVIINKGEIAANDSLQSLLSKYGETSLEPIFIKLTKEV